MCGPVVAPGRDTDPLAGLLTSWPLVMLGVLSYSMYVWHFPLLEAVVVPAWRAGLTLSGWTWLGGLTAAGAWLGCIALSVLTYLRSSAHSFAARSFCTQADEPDQDSAQT